MSSSIKDWLFSATDQAIYYNLSGPLKQHFLECKFFPRLARFLYEVYGLSFVSTKRKDFPIAYTFRRKDCITQAIVFTKPIHWLTPEKLSYPPIGITDNLNESIKAFQMHDINDKFRYLVFLALSMNQMESLEVTA